MSPVTRAAPRDEARGGPHAGSRGPRVAPELSAISRYNDLVARSARSPRMLERLVRAAGVPITRATFDVLVVISRHAPITISALARRLDVDQSTASRQVRPLEAQRLVVRTEDPTDRRVAVLAVTPTGEAVLQRVREVELGDLGAALASWSPHDRARLGELLDRFRNALLALPPADRPTDHEEARR